MHFLPLQNISYHLPCPWCVFSSIEETSYNHSSSSCYGSQWVKLHRITIISSWSFCYRCCSHCSSFAVMAILTFPRFISRPKPRHWAKSWKFANFSSQNCTSDAHSCPISHCADSIQPWWAEFMDCQEFVPVSTRACFDMPLNSSGSFWVERYNTLVCPRSSRQRIHWYVVVLLFTFSVKEMFTNHSIHCACMCKGVFVASTK